MVNAGREPNKAEQGFDKAMAVNHVPEDPGMIQLTRQFGTKGPTFPWWIDAECIVGIARSPANDARGPTRVMVPNGTEIHVTESDEKVRAMRRQAIAAVRCVCIVVDKPASPADPKDPYNVKIVPLAGAEQGAESDE